MRNRFKSWMLWVSIGAFIVWIVAQFGIDIEEQVQQALDLICPIVCALGIINNPQNKDSF